SLRSPLGETAATTFLLCWAAVWLGFFSLASTKLPNYILPAYPPLALLTARFLDRWRRGEVAAGPWVWRPAFAGLVVTGAAAAAAFPPRTADAHKAPRALVAAAGAHRPDADVRVAAFDYFQPSLVFYCGREVQQLFTDRQALDFLRTPLPTYLFCPAETWDRL